jgi:hypothetical protein
MEQQPKSEHIDELITSYLDGELPMEKEDVMFNALASNDDDSRSAMRELISMKNVIPHDHEAFTPPLSAKDAVYSQLGMSNVSNQPQSNWKKAVLPLAFLALGLVGGYGIGDTFSSHEKHEVMQLLSTENRMDGFSPLISGGVSPSVPTIELKQSAPVRIIYKDRVQNIASVTPMITLPPISVNQGQGSTNAKEMTGTSNAANTTPETSEQIIEVVKLEPQITDSKVITPIAKDIQSTVSITNILPESYPQFWLSLRGMSSLHAPEYTGIRKEMGILDNSRVTFAWSLGNHFAVGLEAGREPFVLSYEGIKDERPFMFNQYSPMLTGGLFLQGRTSEIDALGKSRFYAQGVAGGSEIGLLGRLGIGVSYPLTTRISMQMGIEQSYMQFEFQGKSFDSQKLDLLYGISIIL